MTPLQAAVGVVQKVNRFFSFCRMNLLLVKLKRSWGGGVGGSGTTAYNPEEDTSENERTNGEIVGEGSNAETRLLRDNRAATRDSQGSK